MIYVGLASLMLGFLFLIYVVAILIYSIVKRTKISMSIFIPIGLSVVFILTSLGIIVTLMKSL